MALSLWALASQGFSFFTLLLLCGFGTLLSLFSKYMLPSRSENEKRFRRDFREASKAEGGSHGLRAWSPPTPQEGGRGGGADPVVPLAVPA